MTEYTIDYSQEIWKPVVGYEGFYEVSNFGRVRSLERESPVLGRKRILKSRIMSQTWNIRYFMVKLSKNGIPKRLYTHLLVMESFKGPKMKFDVDHKDGNRRNNFLSNLEYVPHTINVLRGQTGKAKNHQIIKGSKNRWRVRIGSLKIDKSFDSLKEAILFRDETLLSNNMAYDGFKNSTWESRNGR